MRSPGVLLLAAVALACCAAGAAAASLLIIDAGSSGSRVSGYEYDPAVLRRDPTKIAARDVAPGKSIAKVRPGLSSLAPAEVGPYLQKLLDAIEGFVPPSERAGTPIFLYATAGLRMVEEGQARRTLEAARAHLSNKTACPYAFKRRQAQVISGSHEGVFGWLALNHLLGTVEAGAGARTAAAIDMGGGSMQITLEPEEAPISNEFPLRLGGTLHALYSHSYLQYGRDAAEARYRRALAQEAADRGVRAVEDACLWSGLEAAVDLPDGRTVTLRGGGSAALCGADIRRLLIGGDGPCEAPPCGLNGEGVPPLADGMPIYAWATFANIGKPLGCWNLTTPACFHAKASGLTLLPPLEVAARLQAAGTPPEFVGGILFSALFCYEVLTAGFRVDPRRPIVVADKVAGSDVGWAFGAAMFEANSIAVPPASVSAPLALPGAEEPAGPKRHAVLVVASSQRTEVTPVEYVEGRFESVRPLATFAAAGTAAAEDGAAAAAALFEGPMRRAAALLPRAAPSAPCVPVSFWATSALRSELGEERRGGRLRLLAAVAARVLAVAAPDANVCPEARERALSGPAEGAMAWLAANWLRGALYDPEDGAVAAAVAELTPGALHVAALPGESPAAHAFPLAVNGTVFELYARAHLGLGLEAARGRYAAAFANYSVPDPCTAASGRPDVDKCRYRIRLALLGLDAFCAAPPCGVYGVFQPPWEAGAPVYALGLFAQIAQAAGCGGGSTPACLLRRAASLLVPASTEQGDPFAVVYAYELLTAGLRLAPEAAVQFAGAVAGREVSPALAAFAYTAQPAGEADARLAAAPAAQAREAGAGATGGGKEGAGLPPIPAWVLAVFAAIALLALLAGGAAWCANRSRPASGPPPAAQPPLPPFAYPQPYGVPGGPGRPQRPAGYMYSQRLGPPRA